MSNYVKTVDFAAKDALVTGDPNKKAQGTQVDTEFNNIATAVATKEDLANKGNANGYASLDTNARVPVSTLPALTGDVTKPAASAVTTIVDDVVTNAKLANMATNTVKGRVTSGSGDPEDLTTTQLLGLILAVDGSGSTLDADTVDGQHASAFAAAVHTHAASDIVSGTFADARIASSSVVQYQSSIKGKNITGLAGVAVTLQADPGGTPSGSPGDMFLYY